MRFGPSQIYEGKRIFAFIIDETQLFKKPLILFGLIVIKILLLYVSPCKNKFVNAVLKLKTLKVLFITIILNIADMMTMLKFICML